MRAGSVSGIEAMRLGLAYEYDPYFSLSIARVDPLPHQLEAVYDYFVKLPRIRFLLADDPGAGKTIMAGLLIKELKIRGLVKRTLVVTPANLSFQWQRELKDKFRENFEIIRSDVLRANYGTNPWQEKNQVITPSALTVSTRTGSLNCGPVRIWPSSGYMAPRAVSLPIRAIMRVSR
jgi:SNF2 family DNA or RNA helicase